MSKENKDIKDSQVKHSEQNEVKDISRRFYQEMVKGVKDMIMPIPQKKR